MSRSLSLALLAANLFAACGAPPVVPPHPASPGVAAAWSSGEVTLAAIEARLPEARSRACLEARRAAGGGSADTLLPCYRQVAERLALESMILAELGDVDAAAVALEDYPQLRRHAYLEAFHRDREEPEISDEAVAERFERDQDQYRRPAQRTVWNLFRRHEDPAHPEATTALLRQLRERFEAGETFGALAREHSQSETRLRNGLVGQLPQGKLPPRLDAIAFSLADGAVSEPIEVRGGAILLHVTESVAAVDLTLDEAAAGIRRQLQAEELRRQAQQRVAEQSPPPEAVIVPVAELTAALDGEDLEAPVLDLAGDRLTVEELRGLAGLAPGQPAGELDEAALQRLADLYEQRVEQGLLYLEVSATASPELRDRAEQHLREAATGQLVDERLRQAVVELAGEDAAALRSYFDDNRHHYLSALRFAVDLWDLPFGDDPPAQLERMEELRLAFEGGGTSLDAAVAELGGERRDLGVVELGELPAEVPGKARTVLPTVEAGRCADPYQQEETLHLLCVRERLEPAPQGYEAVAERVRDDYVQRFGEELSSKVIDRRLGAAGFLFYEAEVKSALTGGGAPPSASPSGS